MMRRGPAILITLPARWFPHRGAAHVPCPPTRAGTCRAAGADTPQTAGRALLFSADLGTS